jgi:hypothetical protein
MIIFLYTVVYKGKLVFPKIASIIIDNYGVGKVSSKPGRKVVALDRMKSETTIGYLKGHSSRDDLF